MNVYDELVDAIREMIEHNARAASPPVERWKVLKSNPLTIEMIGDGLVLEEGDPDVEIDRAVLADRPAPGALVRVHHDGEDWIVAGVIAHG